MKIQSRFRKDFVLIAIGGSAGGISAIQAILKKIPTGFFIPIVVVIHLPANNRGLLSEVLGGWTKSPLREPNDKDPIDSGTIYTAPSGYHLMVEKEKIFCVNLDEPVQFSIPSIDVFFDSAAQAYGDKVLGVILSGANEDGAEGLCRVIKAGGVGIVQTPSTAQSPLMPSSALKLAPSALSLSPDEIGEFLANL
jgi:two-component system chemotaxis response regulator CheB